jgi:hypothetical protein
MNLILFLNFLKIHIKRFKMSEIGNGLIGLNKINDVPA